MDSNVVMKKRNHLAGGLGESPVLWVIPLSVCLILIFIYPLIEIIRLSLTDTKIGGEEYSYTLATIKSLFTDPGFYFMLRTTLFFVFFSVVFQLLNGFVIALSVDTGEKLHMRGTVFVRTVVLISMVIPGVIIGIIWKMMYDESPGGLLNYYLQTLGFSHISFLTDPSIAIVSATVANIWRGTGQSMILLYAGLKTIPKELTEAAMVDGANGFNRLTKIIIPSISPVALISLILNTIGTFNTFDMIMSLTGGGPGRSTEVFALSAYNQIFQLLDLGRGSAIAVLLLLINSVMAAGYFYLLRKGEK